MFSQFVWKGQKPKIRYNVLQGLKTNGGMGLSNIKNKDEALKLQWVYKIMENEALKSLAYAIIGNPISNLIWSIQLNECHLEECFPGNGFWFDVLRLWVKRNLDPPMGKEQVKKQLIWFNSKICIDQKPIFLLQWYEAGIKYIEDLCNENGEPKSLNQMQTSYKLQIPFTTLYCIWDAIPSRWKIW